MKSITSRDNPQYKELKLIATSSQRAGKLPGPCLMASICVSLIYSILDNQSYALCPKRQQMILR